jgi:hypothetical protein
MNKSIANHVRAAFALFLLGVGLYAGIDTLVAHQLSNRGLSSCGSAENPCALAPLQVKAVKAGARLVADASASQGTSQVLGAAPRTPAAPPAAMAES